MDRKRVTVIRIGPVISTKEALYFVGSMVLFFLLKLVFWWLHCFACTVFKKECSKQKRNTIILA